MASSHFDMPSFTTSKQDFSPASLFTMNTCFIIPFFLQIYEILAIYLQLSCVIIEKNVLLGECFHTFLFYSLSLHNYLKNFILYFNEE